MTYRARVCAAGVLLLLAGLSLLVAAGGARSEENDPVESTANPPESFGTAPASTRTEVGKVTEISPDAVPGGESVTDRASEECHRQKVTMAYADSSDNIFLKFTGTKFWCYDGQRVTRAGMDVEPWIRPDSRYEAGQNGYRYVGSALKSSDKFSTYKGHRNGAHESIRVGRFEYRVHGFPEAAQVLNPYISRTSLYTGACDGPKPKDVAPKVTKVRPSGRATGVSPTADVKASFLTPMDASTLSGRTFDLMRGGRLVSASYEYDPTTKTAVLNPQGRLTSGATYTATVYNGPFGVKATSGDPIVASKSWSFKVGR